MKMINGLYVLASPPSPGVMEKEDLKKQTPPVDGGGGVCF